MTDKARSGKGGLFCNYQDSADHLLVCTVCCIYHKPKKFDESSDESDSDASSCGSDDSSRPHNHSHNHNHNHNHSHNHTHNTSHPNNSAARPPTEGLTTETEPPTQPAPPNAYERQPNNSAKGKGKGEPPNPWLYNSGNTAGQGDSGSMSKC